MTYPEAIKLLNDAHLFPSVDVHVKEQSQTITGLHLSYSLATKERRMEICREVLGDEFRVNALSNHDYILIEKK